MFPVCSTVRCLDHVCYQLLTLADPTKYQTEEDKGIIRGLIQNYIVDKRTIILFVLRCHMQESN